MKRILSFLLAATTCEAKSIVTEDLVHRVGIIESNLKPDAVGDDGESLGAFQIGRRAWADAVAYSKLVVGPHEYYLPEDWKGHANDFEMAQRAATFILQMHEERMIKNKVKPTPLKLYMAYNMGWVGAAQHNFDINKTWGFRKAILLRANLILSK
jgi:hypothetical protein